MIESGSFQLSYCAASTRKTNKAAAPNTSSVGVPRSCCWKAISVHSKPMPFGSTWWASCSMRASAVPLATPGAAEPHDLRGRKQVVARDAIGRGDVGEAGHRADRHHQAAGIAHPQPADVADATPELPIRLHHDFVGASEIVEIVYILRAEIDLEGVEHVGRRQPDLLRLFAIDAGVDRWRPGAEQREHAGKGGITVGGAHQRLRRLCQHLGAEAVAVLQHHLEAAGAAEPLHGGRWNGQHESALDARQPAAQVAEHRLGVQAVRGGMVVERTAGPEKIVPSFEATVKVVASRPANGTTCSIPGVARDDTTGLAHDRLGAIQRRTRRQLHDGYQVALVLLGDEPGGRARELEPGKGDQQHVDHHHQAEHPDQAGGEAGVAVRQPREAPVEAAEDQACKARGEVARAAGPHVRRAA